MYPFDNEPEVTDHTVQGSPAWHDFRSKHIGASDVAAVLGISPWISRLKLYQLKTGECEPIRENAAMAAGSYYEPRVREMYEKQKGVTANPCVLEYQPFPVLSCSLDGWDKVNNVIVEIKCSPSTFEKAKLGYIEPHYMAQVQTQLLISQAVSCDFVVFNKDPKDEQIAIVQVTHDLVLQQRIVEECKAFWELVSNRTPPPPDRDPFDNAELEAMLTEYENIQLEIKLLEEKLDVLKENISPFITRDKMKVGPYLTTWVVKRGNIKYSDIPELKSMDLEKYRGAESRFLKITREKKGE